MTKIVFMGTPAFSVPILESLIEAGYDVQAVVTQPDRPVGRKKVITPTPVKEAALKHNLLVLQPEKISGSPEMEKVIDLAPDVIVTAAFVRLMSMPHFYQNIVAAHLYITRLLKEKKKQASRLWKW